MFCLQSIDYWRIHIVHSVSHLNYSFYKCQSLILLIYVKSTSIVIDFKWNHFLKEISNDNSFIFLIKSQFFFIYLILISNLYLFLHICISNKNHLLLIIFIFKKHLYGSINNNRSRKSNAASSISAPTKSNDNKWFSIKICTLWENSTKNIWWFIWYCWYTTYWSHIHWWCISSITKH